MTIGWKRTSLGSLGRVVTGKTPSSERPEEFGDVYPFITPSDIQGMSRTTLTERFLSDTGAIVLKKSMLPPKSVCVVCIGATIGKVTIAEKPSFSNQQINTIIPDATRHCPEFVFYLCRTLAGTLAAFAGGAATPIINKSTFSSIEVPIPTLGTQKKIAAILSAYDDLIANNQRRIVLLEGMAEEIYREWFVRMRFPGWRQAKFKQGISEDWTVLPMEALFKTVSGGTPSRTESENFGGEIAWVKTGELKSMFVNSTEEKITAKGLHSSAAKVLPRHTVVMAMYCAMPDVAILGANAATNQACCSLLPRRPAIRHEWAYFFARMALQQLVNFAHGAAQQNLSQEIIRRFRVLYPGDQLVVQFCEQAKPLFDGIEALSRATNCLAQVRDTLLPRLISGKLKVDHLDIRLPPGMRAEAEATA